MKNFIKRIIDRIHRKPLLVKPDVMHSFIIQKCEQCGKDYKEYNPTESGLKWCNDCLPF